MAVPHFSGLMRRGSEGPGVRRLQTRLRALGWGIAVDGVFGPKTEGVVVAFQLQSPPLVPDGEVGPLTWDALWGKLPKVTPVPAGRAGLGERAYRQAVLLLGVHEQGGNNRGPVVSRIIRENNGVVGEPWCGDAVAYWYRHAGSKAVTRSWAAVRNMLTPGVRRTNRPVRGDIVRFTFDHTGIFSKDLGNGEIETIEGNTGRQGARADGVADGVYRRRRRKDVVRDYLHVTR